MAAKQGLSAQLSQASEDAKRAVLSRTGVTSLTSSSWFANLNTVCTIKSAPPKSPEVLQLLATKSGWLYKRNEQHVWQPRWCCVVPHMFLYYFDVSTAAAAAATTTSLSIPPSIATPLSTNSGAAANFAMGSNANTNANTSNANTINSSVLTNPTSQQQDEWNAAIAKGNGNRNRKQHEKRSNFYLFGGGGGGASNTIPEHDSEQNNDHLISTTNVESNQTNSNTKRSATSYSELDSPTQADTTTATTTTLMDDSSSHFLSANALVAPSLLAHAQPAGIIDLECYTSVHRSAPASSASSTASSALHNHHVILELAGDDQVNPDLRAFYFSARSSQEADDWTDAFLNGRHAALIDECDAYKQVCDGFAQQLQELHAELDSSLAAQEQARQEVYRVRSQSEETRRSVYKILQDCLEQASHKVATTATGTTTASSTMANSMISNSSAASSTGSTTSNHSHTHTTTQNGVNSSSNSNSHAAVQEALSRWDRVRRQDMGLQAASQVVCDFAVQLQDHINQLQKERDGLEAQWKQSGITDNRKVQEMQDEIAQLQAAQNTEREHWRQQMETLQSQYHQSQKELQDVQKELHSTRMEMAMFQTQQKNKAVTLQEHKRILKKEVIDLRAKLEDALSELNTLKHQQSNHAMIAEQERQKNQLLERYVEKIESQVKVQQNMMEMMSQSGVGSVYGGGSVAGGGVGLIGSGMPGGSITSGAVSVLRGGPPQDVAVVRTAHSSSRDSIVGDGFPMGNNSVIHNSNSENANSSTRSPHARNIVVLNGNNDLSCKDVDDDGGDVVDERLKPAFSRGILAASSRRSLLVDDDNKSHMSELTEDRTQRHFDTYRESFGHHPYQHHPSDHFHGNGGPSPRTLLSNRKMAASAQSPRMMSTSPGPPSYILGSSLNQNDNPKNESRNSALDTIHGSAVSLPPGPYSTPRLARRPSNDVPRGPDSSSSVCSEQHHSSGSHQQKQRLSIAQRARLDADRHSTPVRVSIDKSVPATNNTSDPIEDVGPSPDKAKGSRNQSSNSSQHSGLWRRMEEAVLGPRLADLFSDDGSASSFRSTRVTDYTDDDNEIDHRQQQKGTSRRSPEDVREEKKQAEPREVRNIVMSFQFPLNSCFSTVFLFCASKNLSLQERSALQRAKQLQFLKEQGLIKNEQDVRGGAGASPSTAVKDSGSVSSAHLELPQCGSIVGTGTQSSGRS